MGPGPSSLSTRSLCWPYRSFLVGLLEIEMMDSSLSDEIDSVGLTSCNGACWFIIVVSCDGIVPVASPLLCTKNLVPSFR